MRRRNDYELPAYLPAGSEFRLLINAKAVNNLGDIVGIGVTRRGGRGVVTGGRTGAHMWPDVRELGEPQHMSSRQDNRPQFDETTHL